MHLTALFIQKCLCCILSSWTAVIAGHLPPQTVSASYKQNGSICIVTKDQCRKDIDGDVWTDSHWWGPDTSGCDCKNLSMFRRDAMLGQSKATLGAGEDEKGGETTEDKAEAGRTALSHLMKSWRLFRFSFIRSRLCFSFPLYCGTRSSLILKFKYMDFYLCISILVWMTVVYECAWGNRGIRACTLM